MNEKKVKLKIRPFIAMLGVFVFENPQELLKILSFLQTSIFFQTLGDEIL